MEIQPARLLIVVEQTTVILDKTIAKLGALNEWLDNEWVRFVACHPENRQLFLYSVNGWQTVEFTVLWNPLKRIGATINALNIYRYRYPY
jgi:uncharacterized protein YbcC (UPF0753/DUF2309 family)